MLPQNMAPWPIENLKRKKKKKERKILKEFEKLARQERNTLTSLRHFFPECKKIDLHMKVSSCIRRKIIHSCHLRQGIWGQEICTNKPCYLYPYLLVTLYLCTSLTPNPFVLSIFLQIYYFCIQSIRPSCSGHHIVSLFSCEGPHVHVKHSINTVLSAC